MMPQAWVWSGADARGLPSRQPCFLERRCDDQTGIYFRRTGDTGYGTRTAYWRPDQYDGLRGRSPFGGSARDPGWQDWRRRPVSLRRRGTDRPFTARRKRLFGYADGPD